MEKSELGDLEVLGRIMRHALGRVMNIIRYERSVFTVESKAGVTDKERDIVTSADKKAQAVYLEIFRSYFPDFGIIAEEESGGFVLYRTKRRIYFTIDPLDGTKAFARGQSFGVSSMISLVVDKEVVAVFIGDIDTEEIYELWPGADEVRYHRRGFPGETRTLKIDANRSLREQYVLLRLAPHHYSRSARQLFKFNEQISPAPALKPLFKSLSIICSGAGISFSYLWKGVFGALLLEKGYETPWDSSPVLGISRKLGFKFFMIDSLDAKNIREIGPKPIERVYKRDFEVLVIHESRKKELLDWVRENL